MIKTLYSIRDVKLSIFNLPFYQDSAIQAIRQLKMSMMTNPDLLISRFPSDYELFELGTFEDVTGSFDIPEQKKFIISIKILAEEILQETVWRDVINAQTRENAEQAHELRKEKKQKN